MEESEILSPDVDKFDAEKPFNIADEDAIFSTLWTCICITVIVIVGYILFLICRGGYELWKTLI